MTERSGLLSGIRIIEIDAIGPVPLAAMLLADVMRPDRLAALMRLVKTADVLIYTVDPVDDHWTQEQIGAVLYPRTAAEVAAGVTPSTYSYPAGDIRRYGAVINGVSDDTAAVQDAIDSGSPVFHPGGTCILERAVLAINHPDLEPCFIQVNCAVVICIDFLNRRLS